MATGAKGIAGSATGRRRRSTSGKISTCFAIFPLDKDKWYDDPSTWRTPSKASGGFGSDGVSAAAEAKVAAPKHQQESAAAATVVAAAATAAAVAE